MKDAADMNKQHFIEISITTVLLLGSGSVAEAVPAGNTLRNAAADKQGIVKVAENNVEQDNRVIEPQFDPDIIWEVGETVGYGILVFALVLHLYRWIPHSTLQKLEVLGYSTIFVLLVAKLGSAVA